MIIAYLKRNNIFFIILILILSSISLIQTIFKALDNSCDLMWHPSILFWGHVNHYQYTLDGGKLFSDCQYGQYGHLLFIILYPITLLEWEEAKMAWVIVNIFFTFAIPYFISRSYNLSFLKTAIVIIIFLTCHPLKLTIFLGQNSLLILFFLMLPYLSIKKKISKLISFISRYFLLKI